MKLTIIKQFRLVSISEINSFENKHGVILPQDYKNFLMHYNAYDIKETLFNKENKEFWLSNFYPKQ